MLKKRASGEDVSNLDNRIKLIEQAKTNFFDAKKTANLIEDDKIRAKGDIPLTDQIAANQAKLDFQKLVDEGEEEQDIIEQIKSLQTGGKPPFPGLSFNPGLNFGVSPLGEFDTGITSIKPKEEIIVPPEKPNIPKQNIAAPPNFDVSGGAGGSYDRGRDYSGRSDRTAGDRARTRDARKSDLGFSDIRLKENVELIGKSPSNINIYKFNYKDNPTTYQGVMAHEVPWANVEHDNGYMMVDYNKVDVEFKQWQK